MNESEIGTAVQQSQRQPNLPRSAFRSLIASVWGTIPTLLVLATAGGVAWVGHHNNWQIPRASELRGEVKTPDDWCADHNVPESICVECDESLLPKPEPRGWCKVHGIPECTLEHPELAQLTKIPVITSARLDQAQRSLDFVPRRANNPNCRTHLRRIQFATAQDADKSGVLVEPVWTSPVSEFVIAPGEISYDETRIAHLSTRAPGSVKKVFKHLGENVKAGDVLALVDAADVGKAKAELLQALASLQLRQQSLASLNLSAGTVPGVRIQEAEAAVRESEIRLNAARQSLVNLGLPLDMAVIKKTPLNLLEAQLQFLGIPAEVAKTLDPASATTNLLPLVAPLDGMISSRDIVAGEVVDITRVLFTIVDIHALWLTLDLKGEDARRVRVGQTVRFQPDNGHAEVTGTIAWKSGQADPRTRTLKVRANLTDEEGALPANTYGSGRVILREEPKVVSVPNDAVHWEGCCSVVFVRDKNYLKPGAPKVFHVRKVRTGAKDAKNTEIIAGVLPGELVVTQGSGLLLTQLLRDSLGEGCACHSHK